MIDLDWKFNMVPNWISADKVYSYLYKALEIMGKCNYESSIRTVKNRNKKSRCPIPTEEMNNIIKALNSGNEELLKSYYVEYKIRRFV